MKKFNSGHLYDDCHLDDHLVNISKEHYAKRAAAIPWPCREVQANEVNTNPDMAQGEQTYRRGDWGGWKLHRLL